MTKPILDPIAKGFIEWSEQEVPLDDDPSTPVAKLFEDGALANALKGWSHVTNLREELRDNETKMSNLDKTRQPVTFQKRLPNDWDQELDDIAHRLEKGGDAAARKRNTIAVFIKGAVANGESVRELIQYARAGGDPDTAELIADVAAELGL